LPRAPDVPSGPAYDAWNLNALSTQEFEDLAEGNDPLSRAQCIYLASFGLLAPTSHNTVPERFQLLPRPRKIAVWLDRQFVLPQSDSSGRQATISCGCAIAHLCIAANAYGWQSEIEQVTTDLAATTPVGPSTGRYTELVRISFSRHQGVSPMTHWLQAMLARKIVRAEYDPRVTLDDGALAAIHRVAERFPTLGLHLLTDAPTLMVLGKFQELADTTVFNREAFARELGQWLLENNDPSPLAMRGIEFGLSDESALRFHRGLCGAERLLPDEVSGLAKGDNAAMRSASAVIVITSDSDSVAARLDAGRAYAEIALLLQTRGYVTAMHAAITEVEVPNMALRGRLRTSWRPTVVFRVGRPMRVVDGNRPHSVRPPLAQVILPDEGPRPQSNVRKASPATV
jgi:hypothetical protein